MRFLLAACIIATYIVFTVGVLRAHRRKAARAHGAIGAVGAVGGSGAGGSAGAAGGRAHRCSLPTLARAATRSRSPSRQRRRCRPRIFRRACGLSQISASKNSRARERAFSS